MYKLQNTGLLSSFYDIQVSKILMYVFEVYSEIRWVLVFHQSS